MTEATITSGYPIKLGSIGMYSLLLWKLTDIDDGETLTTATGTRIIAFWIQPQTNPSTQGSAGINGVNSGGTITLYPGEDNLAADVFVLVSGN